MHRRPITLITTSLVAFIAFTTFQNLAAEDEDMQKAHPGIIAEVYDVLGVDNSVASRASYGGTAPAQVRTQIKRWRKAFDQ